jgi:PAS domain S-box-containing protein
MCWKRTRFERLLEAVPDALMAMDQKGIVRFVNRRTEWLFGYEREDLIGQRIERVVPEPFWHIYVEHRHDYVADPRSRHRALDLELSGLHQDGTTFPVSISLSQIDTGDVLLVVTAGHDAAKRIRADKHAELIAAIVKYSDDAIISSTLEGVVTSWSPAAEAMFGYSSEEIAGRSSEVLIPEGDMEQVKSVLARIGAGQHIKPFVTLRVRKDGTVFPVSLTLSPICSPDGAIVGVSAISRDMTENEHAAQYARSLIETDLNPLAAINREGTINDVNQAVVALTGVSREALIGTHFSLYATEPDKAKEAYQQAFSQGAVRDYPLTVLNHHGGQTDVLCNFSTYRDRNGNANGALVAARDVTKQKAALDAAEFMAAIIADADDAIISRTFDGIITSWNRAAARMYGYSSEVMIGRSSSVLIPEDRKGEVDAVLARIHAGEHVETFETTRLRKNRTAIRVSLTVSKIRNRDGAIVGASIIGREVTKRE